jgi:hypothetical protein
VTTSIWRADFYITARGDIGTAAALIASGNFEGAVIPTTNQVFFPSTAPASVNADTSVGKDIAITHTPSLTTASIQGQQYVLESMN